MAHDTFLDLKGIPGESTAKGMEKKIEIFSFSWGASNPVSVSSGKGGMSAGKVSLSSFSVNKKTDVASPKLFGMCCTGDHIASMKVTLRKQSGKDGGQVPFLVYDFTEVYVESIQWSGSSGGDDTPQESVSFAYGKVQVEYMTQDATGKMAAGTPVVWDITKSTNA